MKKKEIKKEINALAHHHFTSSWQHGRAEPDRVHSGDSVPRTLAPRHTDMAELTVSTLRLVDEKLQNCDLTERLALSAN